MPNLELLEQLETIVAAKAQPILHRYFLNTTAEMKKDGSIVTEADQEMQQVLAVELKQLRPDILLLGEEMTPQQQAEVLNSDQPYWCLDPLDGTNNFHHGVPLFAVSLALVENRQISMGLVYDPVREECFAAASGSGLRINGQPHRQRAQPEALKQCLASVDFKRLQAPTKQRLLEQMPFKSQRNVGTCALEWAWLAAGRTQLLLHGGEKLWDYAAGTLLLEEAGGRSCALDLAPIFNHSLDSRSVVA
nr:inositol monophosphatase [Gammaproteobacteria bacterium]